MRAELLEEAARRLGIKEDREGAVDEVRQFLQEHELYEKSELRSEKRKEWSVPM